jgi:type IV secretory pathway TrbD component
MAKINKSLYKVPLVGGIEKTPAIIMAVSLCTIMLYAPPYAKILGVVVIVVLWTILAKLNKDDPIFLNVAITYAFQEKFYYAQAMETKRKAKNKLKFNP